MTQARYQTRTVQFAVRWQWTWVIERHSITPRVEDGATDVNDPLRVVMVTGDATLRQYVRTFDTIAFELTLWDESSKIIAVKDVDFLHDDGTWEVDALVRRPELDSACTKGYAIIDTEGNATLLFRGNLLEDEVTENDLNSPQAVPEP